MKRAAMIAAVGLGLIALALPVSAALAATPAAKPAATPATPVTPAATTPATPVTPATTAPATPAAPADPKELINHGLALLDQGKTDEARQAFEKAVAALAAAFKEKPDAGIALHLGRACFYMERDAEAATWLDACLRLAPDNAEAHFMKAGVLRFQNAEDDALKEVETACRLDPNHARWWRELASLQIRKKQYAAAAESSRKARTLDPKSSAAAFQLGVALAELKKPEEAIVLFLEAAKLDPKDSTSCYNAGQAYQNRGDLRPALEQFLEAVRRDGDEWLARAKTVQLYQALGNLKARDAAREELLALRRKGGIPSLAKAISFCRDQFDAGNQHVLAYERFEPDLGDEVMLYVFFLPNESRICYGYHKDIPASDGTANPTWFVEGFSPGMHCTYAAFNRQMTYDEVRAEVEKILRENRGPISASGLAPAENAKPAAPAAKPAKGAKRGAAKPPAEAKP